MPKQSVVALLIFALALTGCADEQTPAAGQVRKTHERLLGTLWIQTALEHKVAGVQAYALATTQVSKALQDKSWTAAIEQTGDYEELPPAVILDVDETVLDNSGFQARLVDKNIEFDQTNWAEWVAEEKAIAMPGAKDFLATLSQQQVAVFYVTNRDFAGEEATVNNLRSVFEIAVSKEQVLCQHEKPEWGSDKSSRRSFLAQHHRIILLVGDDFNDFVFLGKISPQARVEKGSQYQEYWGKKWIQTPNSLYGNWEKALYDYDYSLPEEKKLLLMYEALNTYNKNAQ